MYAGQKSTIKKRFFHHDAALLAAHPEFLDASAGAASSLDAKLEIVRTAVPELAAAASRRAIAEWGRPAADITDLVVATSAGAPPASPLAPRSAAATTPSSGAADTQLE